VAGSLPEASQSFAGQAVVGETFGRLDEGFLREIWTEPPDLGNQLGDQGVEPGRSDFTQDITGMIHSHLFAGLKEAESCAKQTQQCALGHKKRRRSIIHSAPSNAATQVTEIGLGIWRFRSG
jgi:hypothetical protein